LGKILEDQKILARLEAILDTWTDSSQGMALKLTPTLIQELVDKGLLATEAQIAQTSRKAQEKVRDSATQMTEVQRNNLDSDCEQVANL
jgi:multidrug efflux pump subunit AcrA (membrane-fusion protein)